MRINGKFLLLAAFASAAGMATAQDNYDAQNLINSDLNGTARFVSMGGALGALGGDISVMTTNPAGTAIYRGSDAAFTLSGVFTDKGAMSHDASRLSVDQGGAVFAFDQGNPTSKGLQFVNFGVNYHKRRNFLDNKHINVDNLNGNLSQTFQIADLAEQCYENYGYDMKSWGTLAYLSVPIWNEDGSLQRDGIIGEDNQGYYGFGAKDAYYERATFGHTSQVDANLSFNVSDRFFYGMTLSVVDLDYNRESFYSELGVDGNAYDFTNWYKTSGTGFDLKFGFLCRPVEESPFRIGLYLHTPTWYTLTDANGANLYMNDEYLASDENADFDYDFRTPWKFGVSLGHTIGRNIALGAEYEYQDVSSCHYEPAEGDYSSDSKYYFRDVNNISDQILQGQHTLKLGAEYKPVDDVAFRLGYNYVSSPFKDGAYRTITSAGPYSETDYTNWKAINRFTMGVGFRFNGGYFDVTYQYQTQKGEFYAFDNYDATNSQYTLRPTSIKNDRSQLMATIGFRF